jgi:hypothetical protein
LGFEDETWFSRFERPSLHSWAEAGRPTRLLEKKAAKDDPEPKALACYGMYLPGIGETWLRFVDGRPVSAITTQFLSQFLSWCCEKREARSSNGGAREGSAPYLWDNASSHIRAMR